MVFPCVYIAVQNAIITTTVAGVFNLTPKSCGMNPQETLGINSGLFLSLFANLMFYIVFEFCAVYALRTPLSLSFYIKRYTIKREKTITRRSENEAQASFSVLR